MSEDLIQHDIEWVDSNAGLEAACARWANTPLLACDTEFIRSSTYYPKAGLLQFNDGQQTSLVDPLRIDDWYPLIELFESEEHTFAIHSCSEDLEVLQLEIGTVPQRLFDTQIAAAFLGMPSSMGYGAMVAEVLDVTLPKAETRSDWLQRPLSQPQRFYAALDVEYLLPLAQRFQTQLEAKNQFDWVLEEARQMYRNYKALQDLNNSYLRVKAAWKLNARKLAVLMVVARWREHMAQQLDVPRNRIMKEKTLFEIALRCPSHMAQLRAIEGMPERIMRKHGRELIALIQEQVALPEEALPPTLPVALSKQEREEVQALRAEVEPLAESLGIASEILLRKKDCESLWRLAQKAQWDDVEHYFDGWRREVLTPKLMSVLKPS